jgi:hypothetical protein
MTMQFLTRLHIFAGVDKKGRGAMSEVVEAEWLTRLQPAGQDSENSLF